MYDIHVIILPSHIQHKHGKNGNDNVVPFVCILNISQYIHNFWYEMEVTE